MQKISKVRKILYKKVSLGEIMKKFISFIFVVIIGFSGFVFMNQQVICCSFALAETAKYYTVYTDEEKTKVLFLRGDEISAGDNYLSKDNKYYEIVSVDEKTKTAIAKFVRDEEMPKYNVKKKSTMSSAKAATSKKVGVYHTHNDECYYTPDGIDSVYGEGGIHDVGKAFCENLNKLGISIVYREDLHLPHNSGAYTRSQVTANALLDEGVDGIFDLHRDSTKRSEYLTTVDGQQMSSIRMVVGSASANFEENKNFAYNIKAYADEVYPGLIKDIYFGKGNYNQQLTTRAMLFEMGCENIQKDLVIKSTPYLARVLDVVLYGSSSASEESVAEIEMQENGEQIAGLVGDVSGSNVNSNQTLFVVLGIVGASVLILTIVLLSSKKARYKVSRFFSEMFAGIFGKRKAK